MPPLLAVKPIHPRTNARTGRADRNWTKPGGRLLFPWPGALLVGELAQVQHTHTARKDETTPIPVAIISPPHPIPGASGRVGILTHPYTLAAQAAGVY